MSYNYFKRRLYEVCWLSDLETTRLTIAIASLFAALTLFLPDASLTTKKSMFFVGQVFDTIALGLCFLFHSLASLQQLWKEPRNHYYLTANSVFGCTLWTWVTVSYFAAKYALFETFTPSIVSASSVAVFFASWWLLVRVTLEKHCYGCR